MARPKKFRLSPDEVLEPTYAKKLAGHVAEIELFRSQVATLQQQIADIYDAADDDGFDKKFVRLAVGRRAKDALALAATEEAVDAYTKAIETGLSSRVREENPEHDPGTREFVTARIQSSSGALTAKTAVLITTPNPAPPASQDNGGGTAPTGAENALVGADTESTADVAQLAERPICNGQDAGSTPAVSSSSRLLGTTAPPPAAAVGTSLAGAEGDEDRQPNTEPGDGQVGATPIMASEPATGEASAPASPVVAFAPKPYAGPHDSKGPRPVGCLNLDRCGSATWRKACHTCERAMDVTAGGRAVEHHGAVAS